MTKIHNKNKLNQPDNLPQILGQTALIEFPWDEAYKNNSQPIEAPSDPPPMIF